ncbi:MAG: hypothetical protein ACP6IP_09740 [Candidatus Njordarchaeia archaeon]
MKKSVIIIGVLLAWAVATTATTVIYYGEYQRLYEQYVEIKSGFVHVDYAINYGNGTIVWYNNTKFQNGTTVYTALLYIADKVNATVGAFGVFIRGINGINENENDSWMYAINRNDTSVKAWIGVDGWYYPGVSASNLVLQDGDKVVWIFYNWKKYYPPPNPTTTNNVR